MTCIVILEVTAKKGTGTQLVENIRALLPDTRNKDGCQSVEVTTNLDDADNLVLVERWATRKHYENYPRLAAAAWRPRQVSGGVGRAAVDPLFRSDERLSPPGVAMGPFIETVIIAAAVPSSRDTSG